MATKTKIKISDDIELRKIFYPILDRVIGYAINMARKIRVVLIVL